ncbi:MAG TPA: hypothetical protein VFS21_16240, partial [Roseiflexaceae bacterium]|nr:hypothetical protein [Roseiflexaceae bacterium]
MKAQTTPRLRADYLALWGGVAFSLVFTAIIWWVGQRLASVQLLPDQGPSWYYWKLPEPTFWTRATAWGGYLLHQIASWGLIYYAQTRVKRYAKGLHPVNIVALAVNALFILLHLVQTHIWYDGLAQDVSIFSSQGSVIVMLVWVLLMENRRRGMFFGKPAPISQEIVRAARTYHGYVFSWAAIYTFWYHPMETSSGHLIGFVYMFLLLVQGSLFLTRAHVNRWWTLALELMVLVHGTLVALAQSGTQGFWPMFFFGFLGIFIITQMHGLGLSVRVRWGLFALYAGLALWVYSWRGLDKINEIVRIPLIEYVCVLVLAGLIWLVVRAVALFRGQPADR